MLTGEELCRPASDDADGIWPSSVAFGNGLT